MYKRLEDFDSTGLYPENKDAGWAPDTSMDNGGDSGYHTPAPPSPTRVRHGAGGGASSDGEGGEGGQVGAGGEGRQVGGDAGQEEVSGFGCRLTVVDEMPQKEGRPDQPLSDLSIPVPLLHRSNSHNLEDGQPREACRTFTHEDGGVLKTAGSEVTLNIPPGAVPKGQVYNVHAKIHTDLKNHSHLIKSDTEHIVGPIPEYEVEGGGAFDIPAEIVIPHCMDVKPHSVCRVQYGKGSLFEEITADDEDLKYVLKQKTIHISTRHFTKFVCSAECDEIHEITDALLTVAVQNVDLGTKQVTQLRVMIHSRCSAQTDFISDRSQYYDPGMEELKRMKVDLPDRGNLPYPKITVKLTVDEGTGWKNRQINGEEFHPMTQEKAGQDVLSPSRLNPTHRSEQLADFSLERSDSDEDVPLSCHILVTFVYDEGLQKQHVIDVDYPIIQYSRTTRRDSQALLAELYPVSDSLTEVFKSIAKKIGEDFKQLAIHLGVSDHDRAEIERNNQKHFDRSYELLLRWRKTADTPASKETLLQALRDCQREDLVNTATICFNVSDNPALCSRRRTPPSTQKPIIVSTPSGKITEGGF